jgi:hypothetical protein
MPADRDEQIRADAQVAVTRLVRETGVTELQATELITLLGMNWSSLIREARLLKSGR